MGNVPHSVVPVPADLPAADGAPILDTILHNHRVRLYPATSTLAASALSSPTAPSRTGRPPRRQEEVGVPASAQPDDLPTLLFLNGACLTSGGWRRVRELLPGFRALTIDRPGYAGTTLGPLPTLAGEVRALTKILTHLREISDAGAHQILIVAHSMASFQAEALARLIPQHVAGTVLVDPSLVGPYARRPLAAKTAWQVARAALGLRVGEEVSRWVLRMALRSQARRREHLNPEDWSGAWESTEALAAGAGEWLSYRGQARELWALRKRQGGRPAAGEAIMLEAPPYAGPRARGALDAAWDHCEVTQVRASRHLMMIDDPAAITHAIRTLAA